MSGVKWRCGCGLDGRGETNAQKHGTTCARMGWPLSIETVTELARFWSKVDRRGDEECWPWLGTCEKDTGYPVFHLTGGKKERGHRYSLRLKLGRPLLPERMACHLCHNRPCVNPSHLYEGTDKTNSDDKLAAGRHAFGNRHAFTHLTDADVGEIVARFRAGGVMQKELAAEYQVSASQVSCMVNGKAWQHVTNPAWPRPEKP